MQYKNNNRKLGLTGLMRVKNEAQTIAQSIDSCIDALDELIITYNDCTDESVQIIEKKKLQYPDKIIVIPYPYHILGGYGASEEEYEYAKTLPIGHLQLLASYYNNALQYVNYEYVVKIDADQIYFTQSLLILREYIVNGVHQNRIERFCGKIVNVFCQKRDNKRIRLKWHLLYWLQYIVVPLFRKPYVEYAVSELLKGNGYLSLSGVELLQFDGQWHSPIGWLPYNGFGDHLVFEADQQTEYLPWDFQSPSSTKRYLIEGFEHPKEKTIFLIGFYWFHLKSMKSASYNKHISYMGEQDVDTLFPVDRLEKVSFNYINKIHDKSLRIQDKKVDSVFYYLYRNYFNFVHNLDKKTIRSNIAVLNNFSVR